jgi:hypothetical protein
MVLDRNDFTAQHVYAGILPPPHATTMLPLCTETARKSMQISVKVCAIDRLLIVPSWELFRVTGSGPAGFPFTLDARARETRRKSVFGTSPAPSRSNAGPRPGATWRVAASGDVEPYRLTG